MNTINRVFQEGNTAVIKVGSNVLAGNENGMNLKNMQNVVDGITYLMEIGMNVFLVSSGSVAVGRDGIDFGTDLSDDEKALLAGVGQPKLISMYVELFKEKNIIIAQNLLTHNNISNKQEIQNLINVWRIATNNGILSIINENDVVSREELGFSDNDKLAGLIVKAVQADVLVLLSNIDGVYRNYGTEQQEKIDLVSDITTIERYCSDSKSSMGTGGMTSKFTVMSDIMQDDRIGIIANGNEENILQKLAEGESKGTVFI